MKVFLTLNLNEKEAKDLISARRGESKIGLLRWLAKENEKVELCYMEEGPTTVLSGSVVKVRVQGRMNYTEE